MPGVIDTVQSTSSKKRIKRLTIYWIVIILVTFLIGFTLPLFQKSSWSEAMLYLVLALITEGIAYYGQTKGSKPINGAITLNRIMYVLIGVPIGFILWLIIFNFSMNILGSYITDNLSFVVLTLVLSFGLGAVIGDSLGRARQYKGPESYRY